MSKKFFFGVVVGFFVAVVAFVVFLFFSGTVRAAVLPDAQRLVVREVNTVKEVSNVVTQVVGVTGIGVGDKVIDAVEVDELVVSAVRV